MILNIFPNYVRPLVYKYTSSYQLNEQSHSHITHKNGRAAPIENVTLLKDVKPWKIQLDNSR